MKRQIGQRNCRTKLTWIVFASISYLAVPCIAQKSTADSKAVRPPASHSFASTVNVVTPTLLSKFSVPGAAVALIRNGEVVWMHGYGFANIAMAKPVTPETIFNVGSISKTPTAWAVMRLVEEGKVDLDHPIDLYLKRWHLPSSSFDNSQVTVRRLLSHTSGISIHDYHGWDPNQPLPRAEDSLSGKTGTGEVHMVAKPGSAFSYSGANFLILQLLIEEVSGQSFQDYIESRIFQPLHMTNSQYGLPANFRETMATPYDAFGKALPVLRYNELAAAGLTTNLRDLATFAAAGLMGKRGDLPGRGVLKPKSVAMMESPALASRWADKDPYGPNPQYGLGYTVRPEQLAGKTGIGHGGSNSGWESIFQVIPSTGDGIVIVTNTSSGGAVISSLLCSWRHWAVGRGKTVNCPTVDVRIPLYSVYKNKGIADVVVLYRKLRRDEADRYDFSVSQLNSMGYQIMRTGDLQAAVEIFKLNVEAFPGEWNVYDSLGESYLKLGDKPRAIEAYRKSLDLNPYNDNAREVLKTLGIVAQ
jgi:CubicO group peptidase (beta-lactamase class C family)